MSMRGTTLKFDLEPKKAIGENQRPFWVVGRKSGRIRSAKRKRCGYGQQRVNFVVPSNGFHSPSFCEAVRHAPTPAEICAVCQMSGNDFEVSAYDIGAKLCANHDAIGFAHDGGCGTLVSATAQRRGSSWPKAA